MNSISRREWNRQFAIRPCLAIIAMLLCQVAECFHIGSTTHRSALLPPPTNSRMITHAGRSRELFMQAEDSTKNELSEVERLRKKAKELMSEAIAAENALRSSKEQADNLKNMQLDEIYNALTSGVLTETDQEGSEVDLTSESELNSRLMNNLSEKRLGSTTMMQLIERLHKRSSDSEKRIRRMSVGANGDENGFNIGDMSNSREYIERELQMLKWNIDRIIDAQGFLDEKRLDISAPGDVRGLAPVLEARLRELRRTEEEDFQRKLAVKFNDKEEVKVGMGGFVRETMGDQNVTIKVDGKEFSGSKVNMTRLIDDIVQVPMWVPSSILPFLIVCRKDLDPGDLKKLRSEVLTGSQFRVENSDFTKMAAVYRGSFIDKRRAALYGTASIASTSENSDENKGSQSEVVFQDIQDRLKVAGLADRIQLFLMEDPEWRPGDRDPQPLPSILAVSIGVIPEQGSERGIQKNFFAALSILLTIVATFAYAVSGFALNPGFFDAVVNNNDISKLTALAPIVLGVLAISVIHDAAHQLAASKAGVKIGLPIPLPSLQIGTFGSITPLRSFPKSRKALFDVAMSGPLAGALTSIGLMITGIAMTIQASSEALTTFAVVPAAIMKTSFLVGSLCSVMAPKVMALPASQLIPVHPLFLVGFAGLISSALNLLPIGRLDGGRATTSVLGRRSSYLVSLATLSFLAIAALTQTSAISIFFGLLVTLFQRNAEIPMRDELTDVDDVRVGLFIFAIFLTVLSLAPFPGGPAL